MSVVEEIIRGLVECSDMEKVKKVSDEVVEAINQFEPSRQEMMLMAASLASSVRNIMKVPPGEFNAVLINLLDHFDHNERSDNNEPPRGFYSKI